MVAGRPLADWRSAAPYAVLARCGRHAFAWEWLRRWAPYREAAKGRPAAAAAFGLHRFEPLEVGVPVARPIWRGDADPAVLTATAAPARAGSDCFDFAALRAISSFVDGADGVEHWLWSDGVRHIRIDVIAGTLRQGPVVLDYRIAGLAAALPHALTLERLISLTRTGHIVRKLFSAETRAWRWALVLRAHDALTAGASQREIAEQVLELDCSSRWRIEAASTRQRVQRLVALARSAARADPRGWLDGSFP